jgi:hypothetical protein
MLSALACVLIPLVPVLQADPAAELQAAVQKLTEAEGVRFRVLERGSESQVRKPAAGASLGFGGYQEVSGTWKRGQPLQLSLDDLVAFRQGDKLVYKDTQDKASTWKVYDGQPLAIGGARPERGAGGQSSGADPAGAPPAVRKDSKGTTISSSSSSGSTGPALSVAMLAPIRSPTESLAAFGTKADSVHKQSKDGYDIYTGDLTPEAAAALAPRKEAPAGAAGSAPQLQTIGAYSITVKDGAVVEAEFQIHQLAGMQLSRSIRRTIAIKQIGGDVKLEVPPEVVELLK